MKSKKINISAVISLFFIDHLPQDFPQDFLIQQGIPGAKCFLKVGQNGTNILYLHFSREAMKQT